MKVLQRKKQKVRYEVGLCNLEGRKFQRNIEDFICEQCATTVIGDGYTNHCPKCLFSKHVDIKPGDRAAECQGEMKPISSSYKNNRWTIIHRCLKCGATRKNRSAKEDCVDLLIKLSVAKQCK